MVVTRNYRLAWVLLVGAVLLGLLFAFSLVLDAVRGRQVHWYFALWLVFMIIWTVRFIGNVRCLRREGLNARGVS
jgi:hypothetical protein